MLVINRKPGEGFLIGEEITIKILEVRGNQVRIGVKSPPNLIVRREELEFPSAGEGSESRRKNGSDS